MAFMKDLTTELIVLLRSLLTVKGLGNLDQKNKHA